MAYTPPVGDKTPLDFASGYSPPTGDKVALDFGTGITPPGGNQYITVPAIAPTSAPTAAQVRLSFRQVFAGTLGNTSGYGTATVYNLLRYVYAFGHADSVFGTALVELGTPGIFPGGLPPPPDTGINEFRQIPAPTIDFWTRYLDLDTAHRGIAPPIWAAHDISHEIRGIDQAGRGSDTMVFGTPRIEYTSRTVYPNFIASLIFGTHNVARVQVILPTGWANTNMFGTAQLDINLQRLFPVGVAPGPIPSQPFVRNQHEYLRPAGIASFTTGFPIVYNLKQVVYVSKYASDADPTGWPSYSPFVENKIRYLHPSGWMSSRFSVIGNIIENKARAIVVAGWDSFYWNPGNFIAHYTRYVRPEGLDSFYSSRYHGVYNNSVVVHPSGWASSRFGTPSDVRNLNRTVTHHTGPADGYYGTPFVAFRLRTVKPSIFLDPYIPLPEVRLNPYPIRPVGIAPPQWPVVTVEERFSILGPPSVNVHSVQWVGEPFIQNRNKTLKVYPSDQALYGTAKVFNLIQHLTLGIGDTMRFGSALIAYRDRSFPVGTISVPVFTTLHQIRNVIPDPPAQQLILPLGINESYVSTLITVTPVGAYPIGLAPGLFGTPRVRGNGIFPNTIEPVDTFGVPTVLGPQYITARSVPWPATTNQYGSSGSSDQNWTKNIDLGYEWPRLSPHVIYAPSGDEATAQAIANNPPYPEPQYHIMDGLMAAGYANSRYPFFGETTISLKHRIIGPVPSHEQYADTLHPSSIVSDGALVALRLRYIFPVGIRSNRYGLVVLWGAPQFVYLNFSNNGIPPADSYDPVTQPPPSLHTVEHVEPLNRTVAPVGFAGSFGTTSIELFNREISPQGIPHRGNPQQDYTSPWGDTLVGYPRTYILGGLDATLWGDTWVSHYTRSVEAEGWESGTIDDTSIPDFDARMRVRRVSPTRTIAPAGAVHFVAGDALVQQLDRGVLGRGWPSAKIGAPALAMVIFASGWESLEVGDIDRWEAGKIKPHGDDLSSVGTPKLLHPIAPGGVAPAGVGAPTLGSVIRPFGLPAIGFAGPSVTDPYGCSLRVVTPLPVLSVQTVPQPQVAHV